MNDTIIKQCSKCGELKEITEFYKNKKSSDGYQPICKECDKKRATERYKNKREYCLQKNREYHQKNYEKIRVKKSEINKIYRSNNKEKLIQKRKEYYESNKDRIQEKYKQRYNSKDGKEKRFQYILKRRSYKNHVRFTPVQRKKLLDRDNWECQSCGCKVHDGSTGDWNTPDKAHIDHIIPISRGGNSEACNLRVLCRTCNLSKADNEETQLSLNI